MFIDRRFLHYCGATTIAVAGLIFFTVGCGGSDGSVAGTPGAYIAADGIIGGRSFDKFWAPETGWNQADPNIAVYNAKTSFFRCKACHAGDLLGRNGVYINRGATASRPHISPITLRELVNSSTPQQLFDGIKKSNGRRSLTADLSTYDPVNNPTVGDKMPDYSSILNDSQIWDLVKFLKAEALDTSKLYDATTTGAYPTGTIAYSNIGKGGNAAAGDLIYRNQCSWCHGTDGKLIKLGAYYAGGFVRNRPDEAQHKIKFGQLGSSMMSIIKDPKQMLDLYKAMSDETKYPN